MKILQKQAGKDFIILNLTDTQLGADEWAEGHKARRILEYTITELVNRTQPDLITISGDLAWALQDHAYDMLASFLNAFEIPWAFVWGNHDQQHGIEFVEKVAKRYLTYSHCVFEAGDPALGNGNYLIGIEEEGKPVTALVMMDSHDRDPYVNEKGEEQLVWAKLIPAQATWYLEQTETLKKMGYTDVTLLMHIPIYAYRKAAQAAYKPTMDLQSITFEMAEGTDCWNEGYTNSRGVQYEAISSYPEDDGMFEVIKKSGITKRILVGHDHVNNFIIPYEGVDMIFALKTGLGCYWNPILNGGTVLKVNETGVYEVHHEFVDVSWIE